MSKTGSQLILHLEITAFCTILHKKTCCFSIFIVEEKHLLLGNSKAKMFFILLFSCFQLAICLFAKRILHNFLSSNCVSMLDNQF